MNELDDINAATLAYIMDHLPGVPDDTNSLAFFLALVLSAHAEKVAEAVLAEERERMQEPSNN
jgi:hypothetical protein